MGWRSHGTHCGKSFPSSGAEEGDEQVTGEVLRDYEAKQLIASVEDPITQHLLTNAMFHFFKRYYDEKERPVSDIDMLYFASLLKDIFSEHDVLRRILSGERIGSFFDEE
jgi:hypothetical protein